MSETTGSEGHVRRYHATCYWAGDTTMGYESYDRAHACSAPPASTELMLSPTDRRVMLVKSRQQRCKELS
jgi:hypothetical protein